MKVQDRFPLQGNVGWNNSGNAATGFDRYSAGLSYGNLFGLDQQLSYQYTASRDIRRFRANSASYIVPLPWHHTFSLSAGYIDTAIDNPLGASSNSKGHSWQVSGQYAIPLPLIRKYQQTLTAGYDFKESNNNLEFGGFDVFDTATTVSQFSLAYHGTLPDSLGLTQFDIRGVMSPGGMVSNNSTEAFDASRYGAHADYLYGVLGADRTVNLPEDFVLTARAQAQGASTNLLGSEQFSLGGSSSVRGYQESAATGETGWLLSSELHTPGVSLAQLFDKPFAKNVAQDKVYLLGFVDYGRVRSLNLLPGESGSTYLMGAGFGVRYNAGRYVSFLFDYGFQLRNENYGGDPNTSRATLSLNLTY